MYDFIKQYLHSSVESSSCGAVATNLSTSSMWLQLNTVLFRSLSSLLAKQAFSEQVAGSPAGT